jgi:adenine-specific DNA-methyltransferase
MAKIEDLIAQIPDERLRKSIAAEVKVLKKTKKFGLVFEEHLPETVRLPGLQIKPGDLVALKREFGDQLWRVKSVHKNIASCDFAVEGHPPGKETSREISVADLVLVRNFGDPIYPALVPMHRVERGGPNKPWHLLINADNFHALQLLLYCYEGQVDVIYVDPPYNTGARDWKYNNDYVDKNDAFRHSKWLSMMKKRLLFAKRLLRPDGVLVITIDENEVHHLRCLLGTLFDETAIQQTTIVVNPKGVTQGRFSRVEEFALFAFGPDAMPEGKADDYLTPEPDDGFEAVAGMRPRWKGLLRSGTNARREDRENMFYPVLLDPERSAVIGTGEPLPLGKEPNLNKKVDGYTAAWPIRSNSQWGNWGVGHITLRQLIKKGYVGLGEYDEDRKTWALSYLSQQLREQIEGGILEVVSFDKIKNKVDARYAELGARRIKTVWKRSRHDAGVHGSDLVKNLLGRTEAFSFPKSLYAVEDTILPFVRGRKNALILDFFSGSGTTFHATALMNWRDGGQRRCICVTNNEVSEERLRELSAAGLFAGDDEFERHGVANAVTWPRCKAAINGQRADGKKLEGTYLGTNDKQATLELSDGFLENLEYFRVDFLDPAEVARGDAFQAILPILWMKAGCQGERADSKGSQPWLIPKHSSFAVLIKEREFRAFREKLAERNDINWIFIVTDSEENFALMRRMLGRNVECVQLYKSYLENFRLNTPEALGGGNAE